ncbi:MAG TPA: hypothetical protein VHL09_00335 [Dehalococcoidia bacterium]|nr:hypothetical protein [Dehalococcoidia bacterium]
MVTATKPDIVTRYDLVDPTREQPEQGRRIAPRLASLAGKRVGILDNRKDNADVILKRVAERLERDCGTRTALYRTKVVYSRRAEPAMLDELAAECDLVITAVGA